MLLFHQGMLLILRSVQHSWFIIQGSSFATLFLFSYDVHLQLSQLDIHLYHQLELMKVVCHSSFVMKVSHSQLSGSDSHERCCEFPLMYSVVWHVCWWFLEQYILCVSNSTSDMVSSYEHFIKIIKLCPLHGIQVLSLFFDLHGVLLLVEHTSLMHWPIPNHHVWFIQCSLLFGLNCE